MLPTPNSFPHPEFEITHSDLSELIIAIWGYDADAANWATRVSRDPTLDNATKLEFMTDELKRHMERKARKMGAFEQPEDERIRETYEHTGRFRRSVGRIVLGFASNFNSN